MKLETPQDYLIFADELGPLRSREAVARSRRKSRNRFRPASSSVALAKTHTKLIHGSGKAMRI